MSDSHAFVSSELLAADLTEPEKVALERAYAESNTRLLGAALPIGILLLVAFAFWDYAMSPDAARTTIAIRAFLCFLLLSLWLARSSAFVRKWHDWLVCILIGTAGIGIAGVLALIPMGYAAAAGGIALVVMFGAGPVRMPGAQTALASTVIVITTVLLMHLSGESPTMILSVASMLASFGALGLFYNAASRRDARGILASQIRLRAEKEQSEALLRQITTMRQERLTWLESLAHFLRHELSNQIVAVSTSIDLAKSDGSPFGTQTYLERAQRSLGRMRGLVSSATEATSLEAALAVDETEAVDLSGVVMDRVSAFQQFHPLRQFTLKLRPGLSIDGNEARLVQLLDKLLGNAVEHSAEEAEARVELRQAGDGWVELTVENEGDALPEDKERIFEAFVSSQKHSENLGLGLFVARSIARNHGGAIVAEDVPDGPGARFVVRLPEMGAARAGLSEGGASGFKAPGRESEAASRD